MMKNLIQPILGHCERPLVLRSLGEAGQGAWQSSAVRQNPGSLRRLRLLAMTGLLLTMLSACTATRPPAYDLPDSAMLVPGEEITIGRNDNLYTISQRHGVKIRDIIAINEMKPPYILKSGERLTLPSKDRYAAPAPKPAPLDPINKGHMGPKSGTAASNAWYGDSSVSSAPLEPLTTSAAPATMAKPAPAGKTTTETYVLTSPPNDAAKSMQATEAQAAPPVTAESATAPAKASNFTASAGPKAKTGVAEMEIPSFKLGTAEKAGEAKPAASSGAVPQFAWPVRGTITSAFGPKGQGLDNDGINIAAPKGAPVKAAEGGMVAYAGNEMKGFGNLVLIRHEGGWVTAYAHLDRMMVTKDSIVAKGDMIGSVGSSGGVASPQLHFEARQDGKPVDPELVLK